MDILFLNDTSTDNHFGCSLVVENIVKLCNAHGIKIKKTISKSEIQKAQNLSEMICGVDYRVLLINGEGSFHHDSLYCKKLLPGFEQVRKSGKEIYLINASWASNSAESTKHLAWLSEGFFRESLSAKEARLYFNAAKVLPDITLYGGPEAAIQWRAPRKNSANFFKRILYTDSVNMDFSLELERLYGSDKKFDLLAIRYSLPGNLNKIKFIRSFFSTKSLKSFSKFFKTFVYSVKYYLKVPRSLNEFIEKIDAADLVVTARFHVMTCCILRGVPFLAVLPYENSTYTDANKIRGLISDLHLDDRRIVSLDELKEISVIDGYDWNANELTALIKAQSILQNGWKSVFRKIIGELNG